ncbi:MAG: aspartate kinase [Coriobacteriia bacterium]|nr:aspartate kinase [Coriobacteriia bacterium]
MSIIVTKFGGTSLATSERVRAAAERLVAYHNEGKQVVAVVSAMGAATDELLALAKSVNPSPPARELDMLLATGEQVSMSVVAMAVEALGVPAMSLTGRQAGILTSKAHNKATISELKCDRVQKALDGGHIVIVAGFQGTTLEGELTTLGRGGSDTSAVALAAALAADVCEIYSDVDGIYTCDPRVVPRAHKLDEVSYEEMLELAAAGSGVLQMRAIEFARNFKVKLHCRSAFSSANGTLVKEETMEQAVVSGIAFDKSEAKVTIRNVPDALGIAGELFGAIATANINVDMIVQNISEHGHTDISFTVPIGDLTKIKTVLDGLLDKLGIREYVVDDTIAKVSIVGAGMKSNPGIAAKMFTVLAKNGVNISMISTSAIRISVVIDEPSVESAVLALHTAFGLDADEVFEETQLSDEELAAKAKKGR